MGYGPIHVHVVGPLSGASVCYISNGADRISNIMAWMCIAYLHVTNQQKSVRMGRGGEWEDERWRVEDERWRVEDERWRVEDER